MTAPVSSIRNLGLVSDRELAKTGITTADQLHALGLDEAYRRLLASGCRPHFIGYYALVMGLQGRPWNDCQGKEKTDLRNKFDAIKASITSTPANQSDIEEQLNRIGVITR